MLRTEPIICIVDNDAEDRELLMDALQDAGVCNTILQFDDGYSFLSAAGSAGFTDVPKVVVLDLDMPKMGGYAVLESLDAHLSGLQMPVIVLSDNCCKKTDVERVLQLGAKGCYPKPIQYKEYRFIVAAIRELFGDGELG